MTQQNPAGDTVPPGHRRALPAWLIHALVAVLAGGAAFGLMRLTWPGHPGNQLQRRVLQTSDALLALVVAAGAVALVAAVRRARDSRVQDPVSLRHRLGLFLALWALFAVPLVLWWAGEWPGHYYSDVRSSLTVSSRTELDPWLSSFFGLWAHALHRGTGSFPTVALADALLCAALLAEFFSLLLHLGLSRKVGGLFIALLVTSVPVGLLIICMSHDILNAMLRLGVALVLLRVGVRAVLTGQPGTTPATLPSLLALISAAMLLRGDSLALLPYVPLVLLVTRQVRPAAALALVVGVVAATQVYRRAIEPRVAPVWDERAPRYAVSLLLNPVGFMVQNHYFTRTPDEDRAIIDAIVSYQCVVERNRFTEPPCYWTDIRSPVTKEKADAMRRMFLRMVRDNPGLFVANRVAVFSGTLGLDPRGLWPFFPRREQVPPENLYRKEGAALLESQGLDPARAPQGLARVTHWLRDASYPDEGGRTLYFPWNGVPALLLTLWLLTRWRTLPVSAAVAGAIAGPAALVFLAGPGSHPTYVADLWIFGYLAVPLAWFEHTVLRPRRQAAGNAGTSVRSA